MKPSDLIERGWCRSSRARDAEGKSCDPLAPQAISWCPLGALEMAYGTGTPAFYDAALKLIGTVHNGEYDRLSIGLYIARWADHPARQKEDILVAMRQVGL